jgi:hypothetical protein
MAADTQIPVAQGQVMGHQGTRFGGVCCVPATSSAPARVRVAVRHDGRELTAQLHEGDTLRLPGQTWRLVAIHATGYRWHATLVCIG